MMKKILLALCGLLVVSSCTMDSNLKVSICLRIVNNTDYTLSFSNIDCQGSNWMGDYTFYPEKSFTIEPQSEYKQQIDNESQYQPHQVCPFSMDLECDGKTVHFDTSSSLFENPCSSNNWHFQNASSREPAMRIYIITDEHLEKWFGD